MISLGTLAILAAKAAPDGQETEKSMAFEHSLAVRNALISQAREKLAAADSQAAVIETVRQHARNICQSDGITFVLREGDKCHYVEEDAIGPLWKGQKFPISVCIFGWAMQHGETAVIEDVFADPRIPYDAYLPTFVKSLIMTPVGTRHVAAMGAYWKTKRPFTDLEIMTVKTFSALVGGALSELLDNNQQRQR
jgi:two-component system CheB/CheR fusion protein